MVTRTKDQNTYAHGEWNTRCDVCGFKFKASDIRERWDGLMVCDNDYETRHPSDSFKAPKEDQDIAWTRPDAPESGGTDIAGNPLLGGELIPDPYFNRGDVFWALTGDNISISNGELHFSYKNASRTASFTGPDVIKAGKSYTVKVDITSITGSGLLWGLIVSVGGTVGSVDVSSTDSPAVRAANVVTMRNGQTITAAADGTAANTIIGIIGTAIGIGGGAEGSVTSWSIKEA